MVIDLRNGYRDLKQHLGHEIELVFYGDEDDPVNISIECLDCCEVLLEFDKNDLTANPPAV